MNGDGIGDIILGASPGTIGSRSYVLFGSDSGFDPVIDVSTLDGNNGFRLEGPVREAPGAGKFTSVSGAGDFNGDGFADVLVSSFASRDASNGGDGNVGDVYVVLGRSTPFPAVLDLTQLDGTEGFRISGLDSTNNISSYISGAGDINGDGLEDILIGSTWASPGTPARENAGRVHVVFGRATALPADLPIQSLNGENGFTIEGDPPGTHFGSGDHLGVVARAGDVNGDGFDDIVIGAYKAGHEALMRTGATYLIFGKSSGFDAVMSTTTLDGVNGLRIDGIGADDHAGVAISSGDLNGDGFSDILIGAFRASVSGDPARAHAGQCYVLLGTAFTKTESPQVTEDTKVTKDTEDNVTKVTEGGVSVDQNEPMFVILPLDSSWHYPGNNADVDRDGQVTSLDAIVIINEINSPQVTDSSGKLLIAMPLNSTGPFVDVDGDGFVAPMDAIIVLNLLTVVIIEPTGEGESGIDLGMVVEDVALVASGNSNMHLSPEAGPAKSPDISAEQPIKSATATVQRAAATDAAFSEPIQSDVSRRVRKMAASAPSPIESVLDHFASDVANRWLELGRPG